MMGMMGRMRGAAGSSPQRVVSFEPRGATGIPVPLPSRLIEQASNDASRATRRRRFILEMGMGGRMAPPAARRMPGAGRGSGMGVAAINGRAFDMDRVDEQVRLGDLEIWEVSGEMMAHPIHIHGVQFEVLRRNGQSPTVRDQGLRDTVLVQEPVELLVKFTQPAEKAPFMYHCHILEHEDNGMMGQFTTDPG
jgi:FtsP/CotA-like multicopper oxidase with cupredoxin domain